MSEASSAAADAEQVDDGQPDERLAEVAPEMADSEPALESMADDDQRVQGPSSADLPEVSADLAAQLEPDSDTLTPAIENPDEDPLQSADRSDNLAGESPPDTTASDTDPFELRSQEPSTSAPDMAANADELRVPGSEPSFNPEITDLASPRRSVTPSRDDFYAERQADRRRQAAIAGGGSPGSEQAVEEALRWLALVQSPDGRWDPDRLEGGQEHLVFGQHRHGAGARADTGVTGLALLAYLGGGHSHRSGDYRETVQRACEYLIATQKIDGDLSGPATFFARTYCHSMATFALAEALAMTGDPQLRPAVSRAVAFSLATQDVRSGGWRYQAGDAGDTSQLGWQVMALHTADLAGVEVPDQAWQGISRFLGSVIRGGVASYRPRGAPSRTMTAEAFYCQHLLARRRWHTAADNRTLDPRGDTW